VTLWTVLLLASLSCLVAKVVGYFIPERIVKSGPVRRSAELVPAALLSGLISTGVAVDHKHLVFGPPIAGLLTAVVLFSFKVPFLPTVLLAAGVTAILRM
jgi:branched chain amino acid efflux pump